MSGKEGIFSDAELEIQEVLEQIQVKPATVAIPEITIEPTVEVEVIPLKTLKFNANRLGRGYDSWAKEKIKKDGDFENLSNAMTNLLTGLQPYEKGTRVDVFQSLSEGMRLDRKRNGEISDAQKSFMNSQAYKGDLHIAHLWNIAEMSRLSPLTYLIYCTFLLSNQTPQETEQFSNVLHNIIIDPSTADMQISMPEILAAWFFRERT